jgi:hypothetical protein
MSRVDVPLSVVRLLTLVGRHRILTVAGAAPQERRTVRGATRRVVDALVEGPKRRPTGSRSERTMTRIACLTLACLVATTPPSSARRQQSTLFATGANAMAVLSVTTADACPGGSAARASALGVWVEGRYDHELLLFPGSGRDRYETLIGPFAAGRHSVELRPSAFWKPAPCLRTGTAAVSVVEANQPRQVFLRHAPVIELRADTVGEQTDVPLFEYVEDLAQDGVRTLRYTVVFSNEDGGTQTRALFARWGRVADIEQVYDVSLRGNQVVREDFQGPDHEIREFNGRRRGAAPVLLVATLNNMVTDRGRGIAAVRPVPDATDLSGATRESTLDSRPWAYRVMEEEMAAEGRIAAEAPNDDRWLRVAPGPREHLYLEARITRAHAAVAAWARDRNGRRFWSHYERATLAIDRNGWVRTAVAIGADPGSRVVEVGWACLPVPGDAAPGSCVIEATRAFAFGSGWTPGSNLVSPATLELRAGQEAALPGVRPAK